ncbi:hypothetical protein [Sphaerimonospora thailandensis]|uniref:Capsular polysaccharide biosynthesis protein n=1 Tax=Sphaerimonospora thailandensis TaxID=795644 RepID=A0A8J3R743_9ACTN|nr:hypothetical protein [Sphaerimonospora thailandensis]GIH69060.1 hypothetical protein Mth01_13130 [Sphaerimonospora thailandensis]
MDFWKRILGLVRRKFVGPPLITLGILAAVITYLVVPTRYVSSSSMVLTTPATGGTLSADPDEPVGLTNPLLQFNDGLRTTAGILILAMNTPQMLERLGAGDGSPTEIMINDGRTNPELLGMSLNGPFLYIEVDSDSPDTARAVAVRAEQFIREELDARQRALKAPASTHIAVTAVVPPAVPEARRATKLGTAVGALLAVVAGGLGLAYFRERMRDVRRERRSVPDPWGAGPDPQENGAVPRENADEVTPTAPSAR